MPVVARAAAIVLLALWAAPAGAAEASAGPGTPSREYVVDAIDSRVRIEVGTAGIFGFLGHPHLVEAREFGGRIVWNSQHPERSSVELVFDAARIVVLDPDLPEEKRAKVQADMKSKVLEPDRFPEIRFVSSTLRATQRAEDGRPLEATLVGELTLHGVTGALDVPVTLEISDETLRARGEVEFRGSRFGIEPVGVGAGTVKTRDKLRLSFDVVARKAGEGPQDKEQTDG